MAFFEGIIFCLEGGWTRFVSMQAHSNLLYCEREMLQIYKEEKVGVIPWSLLAKGRLMCD